MKKLATAVVAIALIGTPALAADIAVKAAAPSPPAVYNWTGWYAGVNAGASFGNVKTDFNVAPVTLTTNPSFIENSIGLPISASTPGLAGSNREYPDGFMGGGQIGYNWQFSPIWVVGLEADFQGALERDSNNLSQPFDFLTPVTGGGVVVPGVLLSLTGTAVTNYTTQIDWFGTVRGRIGYVWGNGEVMSYLTGGLAYGEVKIDGTNTVSGTLARAASFSITNAFGHSQVNTGWTVGYGTEGRLGNSNWTWKVEGLYIDLGTLDATSVTSGVSFLSSQFSSVTGGQVTTHSRFTDGILRGGLNYKFN